MLRKISLQELPDNSLSFACLELAELLESQMTQSKGYYEKFSWTANKKQHAFYLFLQNPITRNIQHFGLRGAVGSGKSITAIAWFTEQLLKYPGMSVLAMRRTHAEVVASIYTQIKKFNMEYGIPARYKESKSSGPPEITFLNGSKWVFWSSESVVESTTTDTARGLGSTEYSGAFLEEADMIHEEAINTISQRLRQRSGVPVRLIAYVYNPPPETHWLYKKFMGDKESVPEAAKDDYHELHFTMEDNRENLPPGWIESQYAELRNRPALFKRMILGEYGPMMKGEPIYGKYFDHQLHIAKSSFIASWEKQQLYKDGPVCVNFDFGFVTPCITVFQDVQIGTFQQIRIFASWLGKNITLRPFAKYYKDIIDRLFPMAEIECYCDPAGKQADGRGVTKENALDVLRSVGFNPRSKPSDVAAGVDLIIELLSGVTKHKVMGLQPNIIVEPNLKYSSDIIMMLESGFTQDPKSSKFKPYDDDHFIHVSDSLRYGIIHRRSLKKIRNVRGEDPQRAGYVSRELEGAYLPEPLSEEGLRDMLGESPEYGAGYNFGNTMGY